MPWTGKHLNSLFSEQNPMGSPAVVKLVRFSLNEPPMNADERRCDQAEIGVYLRSSAVSFILLLRPPRTWNSIESLIRSCVSRKRSLCR